MATEQELAAANARIAELERADAQRAKAEGVQRELAKYPIVSTAAAQQLSDLIAPQLEITPVSDGRRILHGKDFKPAESVIAETMQRPEYAHYLRQPASQAPTSPAGQAAAPAVPAANPLPPGRLIGALLGQAAREARPDESFGQAMVRAAQGVQAPQGDPRLNPAMPFAIGRGAARK